MVSDGVQSRGHRQLLSGQCEQCCSCSQRRERGKGRHCMTHRTCSTPTSTSVSTTSSSVPVRSDNMIYQDDHILRPILRRPTPAAAAQILQLAIYLSIYLSISMTQIDRR